MNRAVLAGIIVAPAMAELPTAADLTRRLEMGQLAADALELRILWLGGAYAGYVALLPGAPGFAHLSLYLAPDARQSGRGWRFCRDLAGWLQATGAALGLHAVAVHATTPAQARLCQALGCEFGAYLPPRGPVFVAARLDDAGRTLPAAEIARRALPLPFALADALAPGYAAAGLVWRAPDRPALSAREATP